MFFICSYSTTVWTALVNSKSHHVIFQLSCQKEYLLHSISKTKESGY
ncbi:unnamed protein product [Arabidopsis halleri]